MKASAVLHTAGGRKKGQMMGRKFWREAVDPNPESIKYDGKRSGGGTVRELLRALSSSPSPTSLALASVYPLRLPSSFFCFF
jgi:hypothetical protein